jgi:UDP-glucose 4-epimerase
MNVLVTGGLGVNGSPVIRKLIERGLSPIVMDVRPDFSLLEKGSEKRLRFAEGDFTNVDLLDDTLRHHRVERIIHMAAIVGSSQLDPVKSFQINAGGTVQLLEAARRHEIKRFVFTSTRGVYGALDGLAAHPTYQPVGEDHPLRPVQVYDVCKVASEGMGRNYARLHGIEFVALRFATIFGPGKTLRHRNYAVLSQVIEGPLRNEPVRIPQGGDQKDDMIYVEDVADSIVAATFHPQPHFTEYNISTGIGSRLGDLAAAVRHAVPTADIEIGPGLDFMGWGINYCGILDNRRAREDLGWAPRFDLVSAVQDYADRMIRLDLSAG